MHIARRDVSSARELAVAGIDDELPARQRGSERKKSPGEVTIKKPAEGRGEADGRGTADADDERVDENVRLIGPTAAGTADGAAPFTSNAKTPRVTLGALL